MHTPESLVPDNICAATYLTAENTYVPVKAQPAYEAPDQRYRLWEYTDSEGSIRACLLHVQPGQSAGWRILEKAGDSGYFEVQKYVGGAGTLDISNHDGGTRNFTLGAATLLEGANVSAGDTFRVTATETQDLGAYVLAVFPGAPFRLDFEEPVE